MLKIDPLSLRNVLRSGLMRWVCNAKQGRVTHQFHRIARPRPDIDTVLDAGIRHPPHTANDALGEPIAHDLALWIDLHDAAKYKPVFIWEETAHAAGERMGKHRHRSIRKVHAGS